MWMPYLLTAFAMAQNPPATGDPYLPRGNPKSPEGKYECTVTVRTTSPLRYELVDLSDGKSLVTVSAYYPNANSSTIR